MMQGLDCELNILLTVSNSLEIGDANRPPTEDGKQYSGNTVTSDSLCQNTLL